MAKSAKNGIFGHICYRYKALQRAQKGYPL